MNARFICLIASIVVAPSFGQSVQLSATDLWARSGDGASVVIIECAVVGDGLFAGEIALEVESSDLKIATALGDSPFGTVREVNVHKRGQATFLLPLGGSGPTLFPYASPAADISGR